MKVLMTVACQERGISTHLGDACKGQVITTTLRGSLPRAPYANLLSRPDRSLTIVGILPQSHFETLLGNTP